MKTNPCTNPNLPPIRIELSDIPCDESHKQYPNGVRAVKAYWQQATNMTLEDQVEYKTLIEQQHFTWSTPRFSLKDFSVYKSCQTSPTWAKYVFIKAMVIDNTALDNQMQGTFGSLEICDFEVCYRIYNPDPARVLKLKALDQLYQQSHAFSQRDTSVAPVQPQPLNEDLQRLGNRSEDFMDGYLRRIQRFISDACSAQSDEITEQLSLVKDKMYQLEREQTEWFNAIESKVDKLATRFREHEEI